MKHVMLKSLIMISMMISGLAYAKEGETKLTRQAGDGAFTVYPNATELKVALQTVNGEDFTLTAELFTSSCSLASFATLQPIPAERALEVIKGLKETKSVEGPIKYFENLIIDSSSAKRVCHLQLVSVMNFKTISGVKLQAVVNNEPYPISNERCDELVVEFEN